MRDTVCNAAQLTSSPPTPASLQLGVRGHHSYTHPQRETREWMMRTPERPPLDPFRGGRPAAARPTGGGRAVPGDFSLRSSHHPIFSIVSARSCMLVCTVV